MTCNADSIALSCWQAMKAAGRTDIPFSGANGDCANLASILKGEQGFSVILFLEVGWRGRDEDRDRRREGAEVRQGRDRPDPGRRQDARREHPQRQDEGARRPRHARAAQEGQGRLQVVTAQYGHAGRRRPSGRLRVSAPRRASPDDGCDERSRRQLGRRDTGARSSARFRTGSIFIALAILWVVLAFSSPYFFTQTNILNILLQSSTVSILALGVTLVLIAGEIDISVASVQALSGDDGGDGDRHAQRGAVCARDRGRARRGTCSPARSTATSRSLRGSHRSSSRSRCSGSRRALRS